MRSLFKTKKPIPRIQTTSPSSGSSSENNSPQSNAAFNSYRDEPLVSSLVSSKNTSSSSSGNSKMSGVGRLMSSNTSSSSRSSKNTPETKRRARNRNLHNDSEINMDYDEGRPVQQPVVLSQQAQRARREQEMEMDMDENNNDDSNYNGNARRLHVVHSIREKKLNEMLRNVEGLIRVTAPVHVPPPRRSERLRLKRLRKLREEKNRLLDEINDAEYIRNMRNMNFNVDMRNVTIRRK